jgi:XTP/dITP diphosphohydrolase
MKLIFATNNKHKLEEVKKLLSKQFQLITLAEAGINDDIPETGTILEENASIKSHFVFERTGLNCFADDTGLEVEALNGSPGVYSARYAGEKCSFADSVNKLLSKMKEKDNRKARFRTVISLILNGKEYFFEGIVDGEITRDARGGEGFGYDPVFMPEGFEMTFAEMSLEKKNKISHRARAMEKLVEFLSLLPE